MTMRAWVRGQAKKAPENAAFWDRGGVAAAAAGGAGSLSHDTRGRRPSRRPRTPEGGGVPGGGKAHLFG